MPKRPPKITRKITEAVRAAALKLPLIPSITKDSEIGGLELIVNTKRALWGQFLQPRGRDPLTGRRWPVVRHELGDAMTMTVAEAHAASLAAKGAIRQGRDPHRERLTSLAVSVAQRSIIPTTAGDVAALYARTIGARAHLSDRTKRKRIHYVSKAIRLMGGDAVALAAIDVRAVRLMLDAVDGTFERHHVFGELNRFLEWCARRELIPSNTCLAIDRDDRPRPGRSRDHTPPIATIRRAWGAVEDAPDHVRALTRFLFLNPLRREEGQGLLWSEVDFAGKRITIRAERMKGRQPHSLPLSEPALAILAERASCRTADNRVFAPPSSARTINWDYWVKRIRVALGEDDLERSRRFNLHDLRRSFVSELAERNFDVDLLDQLLSHSRKGVFGVYQRSQRWQEREAAMSAWAELVAPSVVTRNNVVALHA
jgi:integrase